MQLHTGRDGLLRNGTLQISNGSATRALGNFGATARPGRMLAIIAAWKRPSGVVTPKETQPGFDIFRFSIGGFCEYFE